MSKGEIECKDIYDCMAVARHERIKLADKNRKNGIPDPLNDFSDSLDEFFKNGGTLFPIKERKSKRHKKRKSLDKL